MFIFERKNKASLTPTLLSRSLTMFNANIRVVGVKGDSIFAQSPK